MNIVFKKQQSFCMLSLVLFASIFLFTCTTDTTNLTQNKNIVISSQELQKSLITNSPNPQQPTATSKTSASGDNTRTFSVYNIPYLSPSAPEYELNVTINFEKDFIDLANQGYFLSITNTSDSNVPVSSFVSPNISIKDGSKLAYILPIPNFSTEQQKNNTVPYFHTQTELQLTPAEQCFTKATNGSSTVTQKSCFTNLTEYNPNDPTSLRQNASKRTFLFNLKTPNPVTTVLYKKVEFLYKKDKYDLHFG